MLDRLHEPVLLSELQCKKFDESSYSPMHLGTDKEALGSQHGLLRQY